jgi:hypothetical protein
MRAFDENASLKTKSAVAAGVVILGMAVASYFNGVDSLSEFGSMFTTDAAQFAFAFAGARGIFKVIENARKKRKEERQAEIDAIFKEVEMEERGNEDVRTR